MRKVGYKLYCELYVFIYILCFEILIVEIRVFIILCLVVYFILGLECGDFGVVKLCRYFYLF